MRAKQMYMVAFASSVGADLNLLCVEAEDREADVLKVQLSGLATLGHVAAWALSPVVSITIDHATTVLRRRFGDVLVDVAERMRPLRSSAAYLVPVWPFDHMMEGELAATAEFLGLTLEVVATPSPDEEVGALLPGRDGLWLIRAHPMF